MQNHLNLPMQTHVKLKALNEAFSIIRQKLETGPNFVSAVLKFSERVRGMSDQCLASALHCFNSDSTRSALKISKATRQAKQNKIKVQPEVVRRRQKMDQDKSKVKAITKSLEV